MVSDDDHQVVPERMVIAYIEEETRARKANEEERNRTTITSSLSGKQKIQESQQNPNLDASSSSYLLGKRKIQEPQQNPNLDHASSPSSSLLGKRKIQEPQQNPNFGGDHASSSSSSCPVESEQRLVVVPNEPVRETTKPVERRKRVRREPVNREREATPEWLVNLMREEKGEDAKLVFVKELTPTDVDKEKGRLLIPWKQIVEINFLDEHELIIIDEHYRKIRDKGVDVILVGSHGQRWDLNFRRWDMNRSSNYVLVSGWNKVVLGNGLLPGHVIRLWSFHSPDRLYFALLPHDPAPALVADPVMAQNAQAMALVAAPVMAQDTQALAPAQNTGLNLAMAQEARTFVNFPRIRRSPRVPVVTRDSEIHGESLHDLAELAATTLEAVQDFEIDSRAINFFAINCLVEIATKDSLEAVQETNTERNIPDLELRL